MFNIFRTAVAITAALLLFSGLSPAQDQQKKDKLLSLQAGDAAPVTIEVEIKDDGLNLDSVSYYLLDNNGRPEMANPQTRPSHVVEIIFRDEPAGFRDALNAIQDGNYSQAAQTLKNIEDAVNSGLSVRARAFWLKQYLIYYAGYAKMMGKNSEDAIKDFDRYMKESPTGYFAALAKIGTGRCQLDLARRNDDKNRFTRARDNFNAAMKLAKVPDLYVQQAKYWLAMTDVYEGKAASAAAFKDIQSALSGGKYSKLEPYVRLNLLCEVQRGRASDPDAGLKILGDVIKKDEVDEATAAAYVAMGDCYRKQNKMKEAALSYLRAALLHQDQRESAAAGLYYASVCFKKSNLPNGAAYSSLLAGELKKSYPDYEAVAMKLFKN